MKKILIIAWKDLITTFRDPSALVLTLVTPLALTLAMAFAFGGFGGGGAGGTGLSGIPVILVNLDRGELGAELTKVFQSGDLDQLIDLALEEDAAEARAAVDADEAAAAVIVPEDLTERVIPSAEGQNEPAAADVELYANPTRPVSVGIVRSVIESFAGQVNSAVASVQVTIAQLVESGRVAPESAAAVAPQLAGRAAHALAAADLVSIAAEETSAAGEGGFNWLAYMAPSMAVLFLMFTVTAGGRSILVERDDGTLPRMLTTPSSSAQVLGGKVLGTYLTGLAQMGILLAATTVMFNASWGSPLAVVIVLLALVAAATAWGIGIAAYARTAAEANVVGTAVTLVFGIGAGHFFPRHLLPPWLRTLSFISPNAWGLEAFLVLGSGGGLRDIAGSAAALVGMAAVVFAAAVVLFRVRLRQ
jgi:ABC-2 type transport system permease protein